MGLGIIFDDQGQGIYEIQNRNGKFAVVDNLGNVCESFDTPERAVAHARFLSGKAGGL